MDIQVDVPAQKTFTPSLGAQKTKVCCADVLDPKARIYAGKLRADFRSLMMSGSHDTLRQKVTSARDAGKITGNFRERHRERPLAQWALNPCNPVGLLQNRFRASGRK